MGQVSITPFGHHEGEQRALVVKKADDTRELFLDSGGGRTAIAEWRTLPGSPSLQWAKPALAQTAAGGPRTLVVSDTLHATVASATIHDLGPAAESEAPFQVMFGSCFSPRDDISTDVAELYHHVRESAGHPAAINLWLGDQVYVDAPWQDGWSAKAPLDVAALKYAANWGVSTDPNIGLAGCMKQAANWFVPDDHEFWNGYPKPSLFTLPLQTMARLLQQGFRLLGSNSPHPAAQWKWASAMGRAFCVFQSELEVDEFDTSVSPPQLQVHDVGDVRMLLLDQRWHRSIRRAGPGAGFMRDADLDRAINMITAQQGLLVLGLARPIVGYMPPLKLLKKAEYGAEDYGSQYRRLWKALRQRADLGRPTLVLSGDVHSFGTQTALDDRLLEMTSSPMSLLRALDDDKFLTRIRRATAEMSRSRRRIAAAYAGEDEPAALPYPVVDDNGDWRAGSGRQRSPVVHPEAGISGVTIDWNDSAQTVRLDTATLELNSYWTSTEHKTAEFRWTGERWAEG